MDLREKKTVRSISNAFLELRAKKPLLPLCIEQELKSVLFQAKPELRSDIQVNVRLSFLLMGVFHAYIQNSKLFNPDDVSSALEELLLQYTGD